MMRVLERPDGLHGIQTRGAEMTHSAMSTNGTKVSNDGVITSVRGSVVDARFDDSLPPIYSLLRAG